MDGAVALSSTYYRGSFVKRYDADGKVWMWVYASLALVDHTLYEITVDEYGPFARASTDSDGDYCWIGAPYGAVTLGDSAWLQIGGKITDAVSDSLDSGAVGYGVGLVAGASAASGADYCGKDGEFAVAIVDSAGADTEQTLMLVPERIKKVGS